MTNFYRLSFVLIGITICAGILDAKDKRPLQDQITVVAHLPVAGGTVTRFLTTEHYRRSYLYAEHESGKAVTLIDVSQAAKPLLLADVAYPAAAGGHEELVVVTGNEALVSSSLATQPAAAPQTFRIMSFADPLHPAVQQEFTGVTATDRDEKRGLIFLANADGVWILQEHYAQDPEFEKEWEHMMLDAR